MLNKQQILEIAKKDPRFAQAVLTIENKLGDKKIPSEVIAKMVHMLEAAVNHPDKYQDIVAAAVKDGMIDPGMFPPKADPVFLMSLLVVFYGMQERQKQGFAKGGLAKAAAKIREHGRNDDSVLAHISPEEAAVLKMRGGSGRTNPATGLPEFDAWSDFRDVLKVVAPIAINFIAPGAGVALGEMLGATGAWAGVLGGGLMGAGSAALTGGNVLQGAVLGGLGGGLGGMAGKGVSEALGLGLGTTGQAMLGSGLIGAAAGAATGKGALQGAISGAGGAYLGQQISGLGDNFTGGMQQGIQAGGQQFGNMMAAGYDPKTALVGAGLTGLATGLSGKNPFEKPSEAVVRDMNGGTGLKASVDPTNPDPYSLQSPQTEGELGVGSSGEGMKLQAPGSSLAGTSATKPGGLFTLKNALMATTLAGMLEDAPEPVKAAVNTMTPQQKELFERPGVTWDWARLQRDAANEDMTLAQFMNQNWPKITGYSEQGTDARAGAYNLPPQPTPPKLARGGPLNAIAGYARGAGSGRADTIDAKLSDGEYVFDAESVAMLGDGSNEEGARRLDQMRSAVRAHKGKALAKGKISPNAKSPLAYLQGVR